MMQQWGLLLLALSARQAAGFYLPGVAPQEYASGAKVDMKVNKLTSTKTQLPYEYYRMPYCKPETIENVAENLGEVLRGDRIVNSLYDLRMGVDETCKILCRKVLTKEEVDLFALRVGEEYRVHWILDNLPAATKFVDDSVPGDPVTVYDVGFPMGFKGAAEIQNTDLGVAYLNNHVAITVKYHKDPSFDGARIVGFEVEPSSVKHTYAGTWSDSPFPKLTSCTGGAGPQPLSAPGEVVFTYDVKWEASEIKWASRWDTYLLMGDEQIHWFSIINSLMIVLFLSGMVAMIMMRTLHRDFQRYNQLEVADEVSPHAPPHRAPLCAAPRATRRAAPCSVGWAPERGSGAGCAGRGSVAVGRGLDVVWLWTGAPAIARQLAQGNGSGTGVKQAWQTRSSSKPDRRWLLLLLHSLLLAGMQRGMVALPLRLSEERSSRLRAGGADDELRQGGAGESSRRHGGEAERAMPAALSSSSVCLPSVPRSLSLSRSLSL
jgi:hypothetical protein